MLSPPQEKNGQLFCSRSCSNSSIKRLASEESKKKVSAKLSGRVINKPQFPAQNKNCVQCASPFIVRHSRKNVVTCSLECAHKLRAKRGALTMRQNGTHAGWHNRRFEPSYPEKYFISLFESENITGWEREKKVGRWFIDFAFMDKMLAVEIDGRQHQDPDRKIKDQEKDAYLESCGFRVIRIPWYNPRTKKGRFLLHPHIHDLLEILK